MVIGNGSASWQIVRDLAMRLPAMVLPKWLKSRMRPVALDDVVAALSAAAELPLQGSGWFDISGPETMRRFLRSTHTMTATTPSSARMRRSRSTPVPMSPTVPCT